LKTVTAELDSGPHDAAAPAVAEAGEAAPMTHADLIRRVALIHAAIDEYEMNALAAYAIEKGRNEKARAS
jgi:hypothetical protein